MNKKFKIIKLEYYKINDIWRLEFKYLNEYYGIKFKCLNNNIKVNEAHNIYNLGFLVFNFPIDNIKKLQLFKVEKMDFLKNYKIIEKYQFIIKEKCIYKLLKNE